MSQASQLSRGKNAIIRAGKSSEQGTGDFHACLYSLRDHPHGSDWSRRLLGAPRKGRCPRALEARLNGAEIASNYFFSACLSLRQSQPRPSFLSRGLLRVCLPKNPRPVLHNSRVARVKQPARQPAVARLLSMSWCARMHLPQHWGWDKPLKPSPQVRGVGRRARLPSVGILRSPEPRRSQSRRAASKLPPPRGRGY